MEGLDKYVVSLKSRSNSNDYDAKIEAGHIYKCVKINSGAIYLSEYPGLPWNPYSFLKLDKLLEE
jgi:hypothetical protein